MDIFSMNVFSLSPCHAAYIIRATQSFENDRRRVHFTSPLAFSQIKTKRGSSERGGWSFRISFAVDKRREKREEVCKETLSTAPVSIVGCFSFN